MAPKSSTSSTCNLAPRAASDLMAFSKEELAAISQVLIGLLQARNFTELLDNMCSALVGPLAIQGCAIYGVSDHGLGLYLLCGVGEYGAHVPDVIPQGSDLYFNIGSSSFTEANEQPSQPSLFEDHPRTLFSPIHSETQFVGAIAAVHNLPTLGALRVILNQASAALGLLYAANKTTDTLSLQAYAGSGVGLKTGAVRACIASDARLTIRENDVLRLLVEGLTNKEIAQRLCISSATCRHHVENILTKFHVHNRSAAVAAGLSYLDRNSAAM